MLDTFTMKSRSADQTQEEIKREIARSLGDAGEKIEVCLVSLRHLEMQLDHAEDTTAYNDLVDEYNALRREAALRMRKLMIQRETIGALNPAYLLSAYPIPARRARRPEE